MNQCKIPSLVISKLSFMKVELSFSVRVCWSAIKMHFFWICNVCHVWFEILFSPLLKLSVKPFPFTSSRICFSKAYFLPTLLWYERVAVFSNNRDLLDCRNRIYPFLQNTYQIEILKIWQLENFHLPGEKDKCQHHWPRYFAHELFEEQNVHFAESTFLRMWINQW